MAKDGLWPTWTKRIWCLSICCGENINNYIFALHVRSRYAESEIDYILYSGYIKHFINKIQLARNLFVLHASDSHTDGQQDFRLFVVFFFCSFWTGTGRVRACVCVFDCLLFVAIHSCYTYYRRSFR